MTSNVEQRQQKEVSLTTLLKGAGPKIRGGAPGEPPLGGLGMCHLVREGRPFQKKIKSCKMSASAFLTVACNDAT